MSGSGRLGVYLNAEPVGTLDKASDGGLSFAYASDWMSRPRSLAISLSLPLRGRPYRGDVVRHVFENLLPDLLPVRRQLAARLGAPGTDIFSLLAAMGRDCVGALQFLPDEERPGAVGTVEGDALSDADLARLLRGLGTQPLGLDPEGTFRLSLAGAQDKTALLRVDDRWMRPVGTTPTTHILKPPLGRNAPDFPLSHSVENEYICLKLCAAFGLEVAEADILKVEDQTALSVRRFDRLWQGDCLFRLPQEDFCQALSHPSSRKYQADGGPTLHAMLTRLVESDRPLEDRETLLRAQIVFYLLGATDGHAKNFSIRHRAGGGFRLAPLYDVLSLQPAVDAGRLAQNAYRLALSVGTRNRYRLDVIALRHFEQSADAAGLPRDSVARIVTDLAARRPQAAAVLERGQQGGLPDILIHALQRGLERRWTALMPSEV